MKRVLTAAILIPLVLVLVFLGPGWMFTLGVAGISLLAGWEFLALARVRAEVAPPRVAVLVALVLLFFGNYRWPDQTATLIGALSLSLLVYCCFVSPVERVLNDAAASTFCLLYTGLTLTTLPSLREQSNGASLVVFLLCVVWAGDIAALYTGRAFGRHKLAPNLSPHKTWEGTLGSVAGSLAIASVLLGLAALLASSSFDRLTARLNFPGGLAHWLMVALVVNVAAQVGDLVESALKRSAGVKDSGAILPGHGGVLDRIDALLLAAPVLWYVQVVQLQF